MIPSTSTALLTLLVVTALPFQTVGSTNLVGNIVTRTDVSSIATITEDVRSMMNHCDQGETSKAVKIYKDGKHSSLSLHDLAKDTKHMRQDITFAFQMYGLAGGRAYMDKTRNPEYEFFDSNYVEQLFSDGKCHDAVNAVQAMVLWMHVNHEVWDAFRKCSIKADPEYDNDAAGIGDMRAEADQILAYWIGSLQQENGPGGTDGHSLYSKTNHVGAFFGTDSIGGAAAANRDIMDIYEGMSGLLSQDDACSEVSKTVEGMWHLTLGLLKYLMVPQIQSLIRAMVEEDYDSIGIHSRIVVPQLSQCRHSDYKYLKDTFLDQQYDPAKLHQTVKVLQGSYSCLGITCRDIGSPRYAGDSSLECYDDFTPIMAGYPASTPVSEQSKIDLDMYQINVLTQFDNESYWDMARYIYMHGKNSVINSDYEDDDGGTISLTTRRSLHLLAISGTRTNVMYYKDFLNYFDDPNYADTAIMQAFRNEGRWRNRTQNQRAAVIRITMQTQLMYMHILSELKDAVVDCSRGDRLDNDGRTDAWDEVAAYIIGSLEGEDVGGSDHFEDGQLLWSLGNKRSFEFSVQNQERYAITNAAIENLLLSGKGQIRASNCDHLERTSDGIAHLLIVSLVQSVVKYAISNQFARWDSTDEDIASGETYANAVIPIIRAYSRNSAATIKKNMVAADFQELVVDGPQAVADAFLAVADEINIHCESIGRSFEVDACLNYQPSLKATSGIEDRGSFLLKAVILSAVTTLTLTLL